MLTESEIRFLPTEDAALTTKSLTVEERRSLEELIDALERDCDVVKAWTGID
jgi:transcriptional/translational regulatory protein YebC/TACO1